MSKYIKRLDKIINDPKVKWLEDFDLYKLKGVWAKAKPHLIEMSEKADLYDTSKQTSKPTQKTRMERKESQIE